MARCQRHLSLRKALSRTHSTALSAGTPSFTTALQLLTSPRLTHSTRVPIRLRKQDGTHTTVRSLDIVVVVASSSALHCCCWIEGWMIGKKAKIDDFARVDPLLRYWCCVSLSQGSRVRGLCPCFSSTPLRETRAFADVRNRTS